METQKRESFRSRLGFILVSAGCAIGIGNVWKFPYIAGQNGGAIFVLIYLAFLVLMGIPVLTMELSMGRAGKSTIARAAAKRFGFLYVDTGAIYRTVAYAVHLAGKSCTDKEAVRALLPTISVSMGYDENGVQRMLLNGDDVSEAIRLPENSIRTSQVSAMP